MVVSWKKYGIIPSNCGQIKHPKIITKCKTARKSIREPFSITHKTENKGKSKVFKSINIENGFLAEA